MIALSELYRRFILAGCCPMCATGFAISTEAFSRGETFDHQRPRDCRGRRNHQTSTCRERAISAHKTTPGASGGAVVARPTVVAVGGTSADEVTGQAPGNTGASGSTTGTLKMGTPDSTSKGVVTGASGTGVVEWGRRASIPVERNIASGQRQP
jgi:hypothetical protein